ncbi:MAG: GreA/GreB family elongation factor [Myxococcota bacterium]
MRSLDKRRVLEALLRQVEAELQTLIAAAEATHEGATHEEAKPENDKDTRALEASYLARGQAARVEETQEIATRLRFLELRSFGEDDPIGVGALVEVDVDGEEATYFLVPVGGGRRVVVEEREIIVVTASSPVGRALLGKEVGDDFELKIGPRRREYEILSAM